MLNTPPDCHLYKDTVVNIILWRHAEAEYGPPDLERALTENGRRQASTIAAWLRRHLPQDAQVWASEAARSRQTADYLTQDYAVLSALNPDINARTLPRLFERLSGNDTVVLVGHQPWLGELSRFLLNGHWQGEAYWSYKKGGFWWLQVKHDGNGYHAKLKAALTPAILLGES